MKTAFDRAWVQSILSDVLAKCGPEADGLQACFAGSECSNMRLAETSIIQASDITRGKVSVRAITGRSSAQASTTDLTASGLVTCARRAIANAKQTPEGDEELTLPSPVAANPIEGAIDLDTATLDSLGKQVWLDPILKAHRHDKLALAGRFHTGIATFAVQSTTGVDTYHQGTWADLSLSALQRPAGHKASSCRTYFDARITPSLVEKMGEEVRSECHRASDPVEVATGEWDVILSPLAVADLLEWFGTIAFTSQSFEDGTSFLHGRIGERVTGEMVTIVDDASVPHGMGVPLPFDVEGMPKQRVELVTRGIGRGIVHNSRSGRRHGCQSTGHAQLSDEFPVSGSQPCHLHLEPGSGSIDDMIGRVKRGLYITRLHYVNGMIEPRRAVMTGLLRDAAFLIEDGRLGRAVAPMRFTDSMLEAFGRIPSPEHISKETRAHCSFFGPLQCTVTPALSIPGLKFTSGR